MVHGANQIVIRLRGQDGAIIPFQSAVDGVGARILRLQRTCAHVVFCDPILRNSPVGFKGKRAVAAEAKGTQAMLHGALQHLLQRAVSVVI